MWAEAVVCACVLPEALLVVAFGGVDVWTSLETVGCGGAGCDVCGGAGADGGSARAWGGARRDSSIASFKTRAGILERIFFLNWAGFQ